MCIDDLCCLEPRRHFRATGFVSLDSLGLARRHLAGDYVGTTMSPCPVAAPSIANRDPTSPAVCPDTNPGAQCPLKSSSFFD